MPDLCQASALQDSNGDMAPIPAGEFWMGRVHLWDRDLLDVTEAARLDDRPAHLVYLDGFFMDKLEVTNAQYERFSESTGHRKPYHWKDGKIPSGKEQWPVYNVSWFDAEAYCRWQNKRLPTEAEWEKAARGGLDRKLYPWGDNLEATQGGSNTPNAKMALFGGASGPVNVGSYPPNGLGLHDMLGNVHEWVSDWYARDYYSISPSRNPRGVETGLYRIFRGGSWADDDNTSDRVLGVQYRNFTDPAIRTVTIGIRCARSMAQ